LKKDSKKHIIKMGTKKDFLEKAIDHLVDKHINEFEDLVEMYRARELNNNGGRNNGIN